MRAAGELRGLQWISPDGRKNYMRGTPKKGCAFRIGKPAGVVVIAEGFATGASVHEATGLCVLAAFDGDNLLPVGRALRAKSASLRLVFAADDDWRTPGNPGLTKARAAAEVLGGALAVPRFGEGRQDCDTDFNDMAAHLGLRAVREQIETGLNREKREVTNDLTDS
jgi:putative DNA primase/helicase